MCLCYLSSLYKENSYDDGSVESPEIVALFLNEVYFQKIFKNIRVCPEVTGNRILGDDSIFLSPQASNCRYFEIAKKKRNWKKILNWYLYSES